VGEYQASLLNYAKGEPKHETLVDCQGTCIRTKY
jgi:hypothetical protein